MADNYFERRLEHNKIQQDYYETKDSPNMKPRDASHYLDRHVEQMITKAGISPEHKIIDIGCGSGRYTLRFAKRGYDIEGLDLTRGLLEALKDNDGGKYNIPLHLTDIIEHDEELDGRFDRVIGFFALHHLFDLNASFKAMEKLTKPGGIIAFLEPNAFNPLYYIQMLITPGMTWKGDKGVAKMRKSLIFKAMNNAGLKNLSIYRFGFFPPFLVNTSWGTKIERFLEKLPFLDPFLPFQLFIGTK